MIIHLRGGSFENKGDELMLRAVVDRFARSCPDVHLAASHGIGSYAQRSQLGLCQMLWHPRLSRLSGTLGYLMLKRYGKSFGIVSESDVQAVVDFMGFSYWDPCGTQNTKAMATLSSRWRKQNKRIVMLPQAFGPFEKKESKEAFVRILDNVDLVFARDSESYQHLRNLPARQDHVEIAPDFTNLLPGVEPACVQDWGRYACVVPNHRMIERTDSAIAENYVAFLARCVRQLDARGVQVVLVSYNPRADSGLIDQIQRAIEKDLPVVCEQDPLLLKGVLRSAFVVIASRYHALVNALSQGVPCLGTGWAHKYQALFQDYSCPECLVPVRISEPDLTMKIESVAEEPGRSRVLTRLTTEASRLAERTRFMWRRTGEVLRLPGLGTLAEQSTPPVRALTETCAPGLG